MNARALLLVAIVSGSAACTGDRLTVETDVADIEGRGPRPAKPAGAGGTAGNGGTSGPGGATGCRRGEAILPTDVTNARDLGGIPVPGGKQVACDALYRGGPFKNLTAQGCARFAQQGIRTVIDLRIADERASYPDAACINDTANTVLAPMPIPYNVSAEDYIVDLNARDAIMNVFSALGNPAAYPVYFHCTYGRDRTGVLAAVILLALGVSSTDILEDYRLSEAVVGAYPLSLMAVLNDVAQRGGIDAYLRTMGVPAEQVAVLRAHVAGP